MVEYREGSRLVNDRMETDLSDIIDAGPAGGLSMVIVHQEFV
jgi:hypothetical protein